MSLTKAKYAAAAANFTVTLASLADGSARESVFIDNSSNLYLDAGLDIAIKLQAGSPAGDKVINLYVYGGWTTSRFTDNATGVDAAVTLRAPTNLILVTSIQCPDSGALTYKAIVGSIAAAFGGMLPKYWGLVVENRTGVAFSATENDHTKAYTGLQAQATAS